jgi:hypothetical protein
MIYFVIFGVVLVLTVVAAAILARGSAAAVRDLSELESRLVPIDLAAFHNLIDSSEVRFLRRSLSSAQFRRVQRARITATFLYVREMASNAAVLIKAGQLVISSRDASPDAVAAAGTMMTSAFQLRLRAMLGLCALSIEYLVPSVNASPDGVASCYDSLSLSLTRVSALYRPHTRTAVSVAI